MDEEELWEEVLRDTARACEDRSRIMRTLLTFSLYRPKIFPMGIDEDP